MQNVFMKTQTIYFEIFAKTEAKNKLTKTYEFNLWAYLTY